MISSSSITSINLRFWLLKLNALNSNSTSENMMIRPKPTVRVKTHDAPEG